MSGTARKVKILDRGSFGAEYHVRNSLNAAVADNEKLRKAIAHTMRDQVVFAATGPGLSVDANAEDVETDNAVIIQSDGNRYALAAASAIDISALIGAASTVSTSKAGVLWVFGSRDGSTMDVEVPERTQAYDSAVIALSHYAAAGEAVTLPPSAGLVPVGCVQVTEGGSGAFTWGTDSITAETETYYSFNGAPCVLSPLASFAKDTGAATFTYGAATFRLGTATIVSATGKTGVTLSGSNIAVASVGAWILYALADDTEFALQTGVSYTSLDAARSAVASLAPNPLMPELGVIYVENRSTAAFVPGTTNLDAAGITATFDINQNPYAAINAYSDLGGYTVTGL